MKPRKHNLLAAFHADLTQPSIFRPSNSRRDSEFAGSGGLSRGQIATQAVIAHTKKTGLSRGSISGLSKAGDDLIEQGQQNRKRGAAHYSKGAR